MCGRSRGLTVRVKFAHSKGRRQQPELTFHSVWTQGFCAQTGHVCVHGLLLTPVLAGWGDRAGELGCPRSSGHTPLQ